MRAVVLLCKSKLQGIATEGPVLHWKGFLVGKTAGEQSTSIFTVSVRALPPYETLFARTGNKTDGMVSAPSVLHSISIENHGVILSLHASHVV